MIVDDTSCKNKFGFPIIAAIAFDENKASQLIAFGLIHGKSIDDFDQFFSELSKKFTIRVFVCDRLRSQTKSILKYFNSHIVYCRIHIRRNIISYCNDEILEGFEELIRGELSKSAFLNLLTAFKATSIEGQKHLKYLITDIDSYAPEELIKLRLRDIRTSNDVESFFGSYKNLTDHDILTIDECVNSIILRYKMLITRSLSFSYKCELPKDIYDGPQIGIKIPSFGKPEIYPSRNADIIKRKSKSGRQKK